MEEKNTEKDYIFEKKLDCPICGKKFGTKVVKTGRARFSGSDIDLRPRYTGVDSVKYDVYMCPKCGYAAGQREFSNVTAHQKETLKTEVCSKFEGTPEPEGEIYTYDNAIVRYKMALLVAIKKPSKVSECAFLCLKIAWLYRGISESLCPDGNMDSLNKNVKEIVQTAKDEENHYMKDAYKGFVEALGKEYPPICGMDEPTVNYLMSVLAYENEDYDAASKYGYSVLSSRNATAKIKDRERDLMDKLKSDKI
jgi:hypothetical protein